MGIIINAERIHTKELKPYKNNAKKHTEKQLKMIEKSIKEYGFLTPILIDKDKNIIAGHGRAEAATRMGMDEIPYVCIEGLTEKQRRAYILADNKITEMGQWDNDLVLEELTELQLEEFDIELTGFDPELLEQNIEDNRWYGDERNRTNKEYNLDLLDNVKLTNDFWQMPIIKNDGFVPDDLTGFNYAKTAKDKSTGIHFYIDDYQFERIWNDPDKYVDMLRKYECILSPDFSLYMDMPMPMKIWNVYRSRKIGAYYQSRGIKVIPTISWAEPESYEFCFQGIPEGSIVSVSTIGVKEKTETMNTWKDGMRAMIESIHPEMILVYGGIIEFDYGEIPVKYYENKVTKEWKER